MKRVTLTLTEQEIKKLKNLSGTEGLTVSELVRRSIDLYLEMKD